MRFELVFNGTTRYFSEIMHEFLETHHDDLERQHFTFVVIDRPDIPEVGVEITGTDNDFGDLYGVPVPRTMTIVARDCPRGTYVVIDCDEDRDWPELKKAWELTRDYLSKRRDNCFAPPWT